MTRDQQISDIRAACIKTNPVCGACGSELYASTGMGKIVFPWQCTNCDNYQEEKDRPIRLADVLSVMGNAFSVDGTGSFFELERVDEDDWIYSVQGTRWNLRQDDLTLQSDECVAFLYELLK